MPRLNIGCSGFFYDHWKGPFYPEDLPKKRWFDYYSARFSTVEFNVTFYRLPDKETFNKWHRETPPGFVFSLKGSKFITHVKKLKASTEPVDVFFSRALALKEKLGAVLWQLPPGLKADPPVTADFIYIRRHGKSGGDAASYSAEELKADAMRIRKYLKQGKDVFVYFNNDASGHGPRNALELMGMLKNENEGVKGSRIRAAR
jgi:uncharacterized protein YecE (DUF72 family)